MPPDSLKPQGGGPGRSTFCGMFAATFFGGETSVPRTLAPLLRAASLLRSRVLGAPLRSDRCKIPFAPSGDEITSYLLLADVSGPASPPPRAGEPTLVNERPDWRSRSRAACLRRFPGVSPDCALAASSYSLRFSSALQPAGRCGFPCASPGGFRLAARRFWKGPHYKHSGERERKVWGVA